MVDESRRSAVKKVGTLGLLAVTGVGGKVYWWDRRDDTLDPDALEAAVEDRAVERASGGDGWDASLVDLSRAEATLEQRGTTSEGGERYDAVLEAPLDGEGAVCGHTDHPAALASSLEQDANDAFIALYNPTRRYAASRQEPFEDRIETYEIRFAARDGTAVAQFTGQQAVEVGGDGLPFTDAYGAEDTLSDAYQAFTEQYHEAFDVECDA